MHGLRHEHGFTLVELLLVALIAGMLAAIALPAYLGQRAKGQDAAAKSDARALVTHMEACYTEHDAYDPCPGANTGIPAGSQRGQVERRTAIGDIYVLVAHSHSGNTFTVEKKADGSTARSCTVGGTPNGGCDGGTW